MDDLGIDELLLQWEGVYKKGLLTFWVLLLLRDRPMYALEMGQELGEVSHDTMSVDERSLYRALRRFEWAGFVSSEWQPSDIGPRRRYYHLTTLGDELLKRFAQRNILLFMEPDIVQRLTPLMETPLDDEHRHA
jgi:PadR family transcriptional regulator, regulatory protein PadR